VGETNQEHFAIDFLLEEYKNLAVSFWKNEETGEKRVNFFITLVTAVIAALIALATNDKGYLPRETIPLITIFSLVGLLLFGIFTLLRMIRRNRVTDEYKKAMGTIRDIFKKFDYQRLKDYDPFKDKRKKRKLGRGGLVETVALINSLIFAAIVTMFAISLPIYKIGLCALGGFIIALTVQFVFVLISYNK